MDAVEFIEQNMGLELFEYQKNFIRELEKIGSDGIITLTSRRGGIYIYPAYSIVKELILDGAQDDSKRSMSNMR
jgi:hypothetical protein